MSLFYALTSAGYHGEPGEFAYDLILPAALPLPNDIVVGPGLHPYKPQRYPSRFAFTFAFVPE